MNTIKNWFTRVWIMFAWHLGYGIYAKQGSRLYWMRILIDAERALNKISAMSDKGIQNYGYICQRFENYTSMLEFQNLFEIPNCYSFDFMLAKENEEAMQRYTTDTNTEVIEFRKLAICFFIAYVEDILENK